jgi:L-ribulose-5-phosphate 4-epimerase
MLRDLKEAVCEANLNLVRRGLVFDTWGNVSGIDRPSGGLVIKPSGIAYDRMRPEDMVVVALEDGRTIEGRLRPSSDTPTHRVLYRAFPAIGGVVHTHSLYATAWAQSGREIPALGTTHADFFFGPAPVTRFLRPSEIRADYEAHTGRAIVERFARLDPGRVPAVLVAGHGPFAWGTSPGQAVTNADVLERVARLALETLRINPAVRPVTPALLRKHFLRKHGPDATYGQRSPIPCLPAASAARAPDAGEIPRPSRARPSAGLPGRR